LRDRDTRLITGAVGVSALGDFLLWIPLTLHLQEQTGSGLYGRRSRWPDPALAAPADTV
jgi:hypothetical protein